MSCSQDEIKIIPSLMRDTLRIADNMRESDVREVYASCHHTPYEALQKCYRRSRLVFTVFGPRGPMAMFGVVPSGLPGHGIAWFLGTDETKNYAREFARRSEFYMDQMNYHFPMIYNLIHAENETAIKWLKRYGWIEHVRSSEFTAEAEEFVLMYRLKE